MQMNKRSELAKKLAEKHNAFIKTEEAAAAAAGAGGKGGGGGDKEDAEFTTTTEDDDPDRFAAFGRYDKSSNLYSFGNFG